MNDQLVKISENNKLKKELLKRNLTMVDILNLFENITTIKKTIIEIKYRIRHRYYIFVLDGTENNMEEIIQCFNKHMNDKKTDKEILLIEFNVEIFGNSNMCELLYSKNALKYINKYIENMDIEMRMNKFEIEELIINEIWKDNKTKQIKRIKNINLLINDSTFLNIIF
jgi:hypothetical protein